MKRQRYKSFGCAECFETFPITDKIGVRFDGGIVNPICVKCCREIGVKVLAPVGRIVLRFTKRNGWTASVKRKAT